MKNRIMAQRNQTNNKKAISVYYIEGVDIDHLINTHINLLKEEGDKSNLNLSILTAKYEFLIHLICRRHLNDKHGAVTLNTKVLQTTFKTTYKMMLDVLTECKIISIHPYYKPGETSRTITLLKPHNELIKEKKPADLLQFNKLNKLSVDTLTDENKERKQSDIKKLEAKNPDISTILEIYNRNLKLLRIVDKAELENYISEKYYISQRQKDYYLNIQEQYINNHKSFEYKSIDNNNRIYSILTETPRYIKNFLNIKFSIDIKNSHPLLFNYFIINKLNINLSLLNSLYRYVSSNYKSLILKTNITTNDVIDNISNYICINQKEKEEFARIPTDIWLYILKTSIGRFWDDFKDNFTEYGLNRNDVKQTIFHEVFYSHSFTAYGKIFAKSFEAIYPNVFKLVTEMKVERKYAVTIAKSKAKTLEEKMVAAVMAEVSGKTKHIANDMMQLESDIFFEILTKLYKRRDCKALTIHDAILVLNVNKIVCEPKAVMDIMKKVYKKYHLFPEFGVDKYDSLKWKSESEKEKSNQPLIAAKIKELENLASNGQKQAIEILELLNDNQIELVVDNSDNSLHFHRLFKHSTKRGEKGSVTKKYKQIQKATKKYLEN
jgi:hypothetical protein